MGVAQKSWKKKEQWNGVDAASIHGAPDFLRIAQKNKKKLKKIIKKLEQSMRA